MAHMIDNSAASQSTLNIGTENTRGKRLNRARNSDSVDFSTLCFVLLRKGMTHRPTQAVLPLA